MLFRSAVTKATGLPSLADDSGLAVHALGGEPGIYSARWAGPSKDFALAMKKVEDALAVKGAQDRGAHFVCVLLALGPGREEHVFEGLASGHLLDTPRGGAGFGYDPLFVPSGHARTFAEMSEAEKNSLSHRAHAWAKLAEWLRGRADG